MNKRRFVFVILIIIFSNFILWGEIPFYFQGEIQTSPWFYEPLYEMNCTRLATEWMTQIEINWFKAGLDIYCNYSSLDGKKDSYLFKGALFDLGGNIVTKYKLTSWIELTLSTGLFWNQSSFDLNNSGWLGRSLLGFEAAAGLMLFITNHFHMEIINKFDLLFSQNNLDYTIGTRAYFDPGIHWLNLYAELDAFYWQYSSEILPDGVKTWMFQAQVGVSFYFNTKQDDKNASDTRINKDILLKSSAENNNYKKQYTDATLAQLQNSRAGDTLLFYTIFFNDEEVTLKSLPVLDEMAQILVDNNSLVISISGYAQFMKDPLRELELSKSRAYKIKGYLTAKGVKDSQIQLNRVGNIITDKNTYVMINVIKNDL